MTQSDDDLLETLQRGAFDYFLDYSDETTGLIADTSRQGSPASIAVVGFALSCYPIAVERGWLTRSEAVGKTLKVLRFFWSSVQSAEADVTGYKGFYYHFLEMRTGKRVWNCELSLIDTGLLMAGMLTAATYFSASCEEEDEIRSLADGLYRRADWPWAQNGGRTLSQGWKPECGFLHSGWEGYSEATILYVLGLASPNFPLPLDSFGSWTMTYQWENIYGYEILYAGPLFIHLFSHAWIDFRGIRDEFMREKNSDYFENSRRAAYVQREYARRNPHQFEGYGEDCWGITACDGPGFNANMPLAIRTAILAMVRIAGVSLLATARVMKRCARVTEIGGFSAIPNVACHLVAMTGQSRHGGCLQRCHFRHPHHLRRYGKYWRNTPISARIGECRAPST